jgi:hypothetical protein
VRGEGFADVADADQTEPGPWQGTIDEREGSVGSGDAVTVGVTGDYPLGHE